MIIATFADFHLGVKTFGDIDENTGLNTREINALSSLDLFIDNCIEKKADIITFAGDMFKNSLPTPSLQNELNVRIKRIIDANIFLILIDGNHDVSKLETSVSALICADTFKLPNVIHTRFHKEYVFTKNNQSVKFVMLPTHHTPEEIKTIVETTVYSGEPIVFIGHLTMAGAQLNDWLVIENEKCIDLNIFNKDHVAAVVLGHLHKHQILMKKPLVYYTGSLQRIDFSEENQEKGFVMLNILPDESVKYKFVPIESQKFFSIELKSENNNIQQELLNNIKINKDKIENAILRVNIELDEGDLFDDVLINKEIFDCNPLYFSSVHKTYNWSKQQRNVDLTENISVASGLKMYYQDKYRSDERIKLGQNIIDSIENI